MGWSHWIFGNYFRHSTISSKLVAQSSTPWIVTVETQQKSLKNWIWGPTVRLHLTNSTTEPVSHCKIGSIDYQANCIPAATCIASTSPEPSCFPLWLKKSQNVTCIVSEITFVMLSLLTRYKWGPFHFLIHKPKSDAAIFHQQKLNKVYDQNIQNHALQTYVLAWSY